MTMSLFTKVKSLFFLELSLLPSLTSSLIVIYTFLTVELPTHIFNNNVTINLCHINETSNYFCSNDFAAVVYENPDTFCILSDSLALIALYNATNGPNWSQSWNLEEPFSDWFGISTNNDGCVVEIELFNNQLSGYLPAEIGNLSNLRNLELDGNQLSGTIPPAIGKLSELRLLLLHSNDLSGVIPYQIGQLSNLRKLILNDNRLSGSIPETLGNLTNLQTIFLQNNQLECCFPLSLLAFCNIGRNFSKNPDLPGAGDFDTFCDTGISYMWPGDFNKDGIVDNNDFLQWGQVAIGSTGSARSNPSTEWGRQESFDWSTSTNNINHKYFDSDGNGVINDLDLQAYRDNYNKTHSCKKSNTYHVNVVNYRLERVPNIADQKYELYIEDLEGMPISTHGVAVTIDFSILDVESRILDINHSSLQPDLVRDTFIEHKNIWEIALTRTDKIDVLCDGPIASFIVIVDELGAAGEITLRANNGSHLQANGISNNIGSTYIYDTQAGPSAEPVLSATISVTPEQCTVLGTARINITDIGTAPYTIEWSTGEENITRVTNLSADEYTVTITDVKNTRLTYTFEVEGSTPVYDEDGALIACHPIECRATRSFTNTIANGTYQVANSITANSLITTDKDIIFKAGDYITLTPGFEVAAGATFLATIDGCTTNTFYTISPSFSRATLPSTSIISDQLVIEVSPNPAKHHAAIVYNLPFAGVVDLSIINIQGQIKLREKVYQEAGKQTINLTTAGFSSGLYLIKIQTQNILQTQKILIQN